MTTHLAPLPPPRDPNNSSSQEGTVEHSLMAFYTESINLYNILDRILADVYNSCRGRAPQHQSQQVTKSPGGLDIILDIERQLTLFEANLPSFLKWPAGPPGAHVDGEPNLVIAQQRNVLHARCVVLRLIIHQLTAYLTVQIHPSPPSPLPPDLHTTLLGNVANSRFNNRTRAARERDVLRNCAEHIILLNIQKMRYLVRGGSH